jgi:hypothetical protein
MTPSTREAVAADRRKKSRAAAADQRTNSWWHCLDWLFNHLPVVAVVAAVAAVVSVFFAIRAAGTEGDPDPYKNAIRLISACWTTLPAVYFFLEFHWARATQPPTVFRRVKESQKVAQKVWAGVVVALAVIYLKQP